jgi:hypothetical protein
MYKWLYKQRVHIDKYEKEREKLKIYQIKKRNRKQHFNIYTIVNRGSKKSEYVRTNTLFKPRKQMDV